MKQNKLHNNDCCEVTFLGLQGWYVKEFQQLGWMILAKDKGLNEKVITYIHSLQHLLHSLEKKIKDIKDIDKKNDLKLMIKNVKILIKHVEKDFKVNY